MLHFSYEIFHTWLSQDVSLVRLNLEPLANREEGINSAVAFAVTSNFISLCFSQFYITNIIEQGEKILDVFEIKYLGLHHNLE